MSEDTDRILAELEKLRILLEDTTRLQRSAREDLGIISGNMKTIREHMAAVRERVETLKLPPPEDRPLNPLATIKKDPWIRHWETLSARRASSR